MKKVTSILVALMMLFSICTVVASAAVNDAVAALRVTSTATSYNPGDEVTFEVSYETTSDLGGVGVCVITIGYDSDVFEPVEEITAAGTTLDKATTVSLTGYALDGKVSLANSFVQMKGDLTSVDTAKGWDTALKIALTKDVGAAWIDASSEVKVLSFKLKVKADAVGGTHAVGITDGSIQDGTTSLDEEAGAVAGPSGPEYGFAQSKIFDLGDASVTVEGGSTGPDQPTEINVAVKNLDPKVQWRAAGSSDLYIGFEGELSGFTKDQAETVIASISELGIEFSSTDATLATSIKATTNVVYDFTAGDAGVYKFRAVVRKAMSEADAAGTITHNLYARAFVKIGDKAPITASDIISTTIHDEYTEGVNNKMLTLAENLAAK